MKLLLHYMTGTSIIILPGMGKKVTKHHRKRSKGWRGKNYRGKVSKNDDQKLLGQIQSQMSRSELA